MELRQLRYFLAVARTKNITRAAEEVHIAQPPLSRQLTHLEEELGVKLLDRGSRIVQLTPAGEYFAEHAREILKKVQRLKEETVAMGDTGQRTFRHGVELSLLYGRAPAIIRQLRERHPQYRVEFSVLPADRLLGALRDGEIDLALGRELDKGSDIDQFLLRQEPLFLALPLGHEAAKNAAGIHLGALKAGPVIVHTTSGSTRSDPIRRLCEDAGIEASNMVVLGDVSAVLGLVAAGGGVAIVPSMARAIRRDDVEYIPLLGEKAVSPVAISVMRGKHQAYFQDLCDEGSRILLTQEREKVQHSQAFQGQ